jgi:hypothetical protein
MHTHKVNAIDHASIVGALFKRAMRKVLAAAVGGPILLAAVGVVFASGPLLPVPVSTSPSNGDLNPYGVLFVSSNPGGTLKSGDILVSNFNNSTNVMGTGTTIVDIRKGAQLTTPFYTAAATADGLDLALGQVGKFIVVGNVPVVGSVPGPGALTVLNSSGAVVNSLSGAFINGPWGLAITALDQTTRPPLRSFCLLARFLASFATKSPNRPSAAACGFFRFSLFHHSAPSPHLHSPDITSTDLILLR